MLRLVGVQKRGVRRRNKNVATTPRLDERERKAKGGKGCQILYAQITHTSFIVSLVRFLKTGDFFFSLVNIFFSHVYYPASARIVSGVPTRPPPSLTQRCTHNFIRHMEARMTTTCYPPPTPMGADRFQNSLIPLFFI